MCSLSAVFFHMTSHITEAGVNLDVCGSNWRFAVWVVVCCMGASITSAGGNQRAVLNATSSDIDYPGTKGSLTGIS